MSDALGLGVLLLLALLASATQTEHQVEGALLLDVVVRKSAAVLELLAGEDQTLLIRGNAFLVLDLGLDVFDGVGRLDIEGDGLTREGLHENLHVGSVSLSSSLEREVRPRKTLKNKLNGNNLRGVGNAQQTQKGKKTDTPSTTSSRCTASCSQIACPCCQAGQRR